MTPRSLAGPLVIGTAVWCALGVITLSDAENAGTRLVVPAGFLWWVAAVGAATLVRRWRTEPVTTLPAVLSTLPWWPVPLPAVGLFWTGRLTWVPILVSAVLAAWPARASTGVTEPRPSRPWRAAILAGLLTVAVGGIAAGTLAGRLPAGDEPHYLVITQSLLTDGDLRIENNHERRDYATYFTGTLQPDFLRRGKDGEIYSIHAPGTSVLVLPAFALFGYRGAQLTILLAAALTGMLVWMLGWRATSDVGAAWFAWASIALSATFVLQSVMVFPDGPAALATALGLTAVLQARAAAPRLSRWSVFGVGLALATLPWFHTRLVVLSVGIGGLLTWELLADRTRELADRLQRLLLFLAIPILSAAGWFTFFFVIYGTPNPSAPYGPNPDTRLAYVPGGLLALLLDEQFGLLTYAPALLACLAAVGRRRPDRALWGGLAVGVAYLAASATYWMWYAGVPATPARFATAMLPAFAAPVAVGWHRSGPNGRALWAVLLAVSISLTAVLIVGADGSLGWNVRFAPVQWIVWLGSVADLARGLPSFFWQLAPGDVTTEWPFVLHVGIVLGVFLAGGLIISVMGWRRPALAAALGWLLSVMAAAQAGWRWQGQSGVDPTASQLKLLREVAAGRRPYRLAGFSVARLAHVNGLVRLRANTPNGARPPELPAVVLSGLPAGSYDAVVTSRRPAPGTLTLRVGETPAPIQASLRPMTTQSVRLSLPAGATSLAIEPDALLRRVGEAIDLRLVTLEPGDGRLALAQATYGALTVAFLDRAVFVEPDGFWVKGGETAEFVVDGASRTSVVTMALANGGAANTAHLQVGGRTEHIALNPGQETEVRLPISSRPARVRLTSETGARPAPEGTSGDARFLGVRVRVF